jgi:predicted GNAT family N-acyltransferase
MDLSSFSLIRLSENHEIKSFDCEDDDLNDFFNNSSKNYQKELLAVTYVLESHDQTVAFFSLLNDKISIKDTSNNLWNRLRRKLPNSKRSASYPAMKIGRLGVNCNFKGKGIGTSILGYLKVLFITNNRTGCKFITVDAYRQSLEFYEKNGFDYLTEDDRNSDTRLMYFDLALIREPLL